MGSQFGDTAGVKIQTTPAWDRFAHWPQFRARLALLALLLVLAAAALVPFRDSNPTVDARPVAAQQRITEPTRDKDLALYDRAIDRIRKGENYYDFIVEEQRRDNFPVRPSLTVRLPTLAYIQAWLGSTGQAVTAFALVFLVAAAWWQRLGREPGGDEQRILMMMLLLLTAPLALNQYYFVLHELKAGLLMALAFALHRPGKWGASLGIAALALAIREHTLPFVLLMGAMAFWHRDWKEGAAWSALVIAFFAALAMHDHMVAAQVLPDDRPSDPWLVARGLPGWLMNIVQSSPLHGLPDWLAGPLVVLTLAGWAGWRSPAGVFGTFLYLGYGLAFMIAGRANNFYWGTIVTPAMFMGLAFAPRAVTSLFTTAFPREMPQLALAK